MSTGATQGGGTVAKKPVAKKPVAKKPVPKQAAPKPKAAQQQKPVTFQENKPFNQGKQDCPLQKVKPCDVQKLIVKDEKTGRKLETTKKLVLEKVPPGTPKWLIDRPMSRSGFTSVEYSSSSPSPRSMTTPISMIRSTRVTPVAWTPMNALPSASWISPRLRARNRETSRSTFT